MIRPIVERVGDELKINLFPKQAEFEASEVDDLFYGGQAGGAKSTAIMISAALRRVKHAGSMGLILRRTYPELEKSLIQKSRDVYPFFGAKYHEANKVWKFPNGSLQYFGYTESDKDVYQFQSAEYQDIWFDEASHFCVNPETDVLTNSGWKKITQVQLSDQIATLSPSYEIEYHPPTRLWKIPYSGNLYELNQRKGLAFSVTPNHRMVVQQPRKNEWYFQEAQKLGNFTYHVRSGDYEGNRIEFIDLEIPVNRGCGRNVNAVKKVSTDDYMTFLGWYFSEGCSWERKVKAGKYSGPVVCISQLKKLPELEDTLKRMGFKFNYVGNGYHIYSRQLFELVKDYGNSYEKRIPRWIFSLGKEQIQKFYEAFIDGDGSRGKHGMTLIGLVNEGLIDDLQEMATLLGYVATKGFSVFEPSGLLKSRTKLKKGHPAYMSHCWRLSISKRRKYYGEVRKKDIKVVPYEGNVWCLTVEPNHNFFCRYKGRVSVTGNTEFQISYITSRCRSTIPGCKAIIRLASNPGNIGHHYLKKRYIEPAKISKIWKDERTGKTLGFISAKLEDNPAMMELDPGYKSRLRELGEQKYMALAEGNWEVAEGQYFDYDLRVGMGVLPYIRVPDSDTFKFLSMDWGYKEPAAIYWWEVMPSGRIFIYRELYVTGLSPKELAAKILEMSPSGERYEYIACPWDVFGKETELEGGGEKIIDSMQSIWGNKLNPVRAPSARVEGWSKLSSFFSLAGDGRPWMQISPVCENLIRTIPTMIHDDKNPNDCSKRAEDHGMDSLRYGAMTIQNISRNMNEIISPYERLFGISSQVSKNQSFLPSTGKGGYGR